MSIEVSVIIPVYNEERYIARCLDSILQQDYPEEQMEVIIVDGNSTDSTSDIIDFYLKKHPFMKMIVNPDRIVPKAMNLGIKVASGKIIMRADAHTSYSQTYIETCMATMNKIEADNVGGVITTLPGKNTLIAKAISLATSNIFGVGNSRFRISDKAGYTDTVPFGAYRKEIFDKIGLYNEKLIRNQDIELNARIIEDGGKIYLNPEIKSYYYNRSTLRELWQQNFNNGIWNVFTMLINPHSLSLRHFVPFAFVLFLILSMIIGLFSPIGIIALMSILSSYVIVSLIFSIHLSVKNGFQLILVLPIVFWVLHVSYGLGSCWGIITIQNLKKKLKQKADA